MVTTEIIRLLYSGPAYTDIKLALGDLKGRFARMTGIYGAKDFVGLKYCEVFVS